MAKVLKFVPIDIHANNKNRLKPVIAVCKHGSVCRFPSVRAAAQMMDIPESNIVSCLKGRLKTAGGCYWKYADDFCSYGERREGE